jgi:hypothetical protein
VTSIDAKLVANGLEVRIAGQLSLFSTGSLVESLPYSASVAVHLMPAVVPDPGRLCEVSIDSDLQLRWDGYVDALSEKLLPLIKSSLTTKVAAEISEAANRELAARIHAAFALATLPPGVTVSLRRVEIAHTALRLQPILGTLGDTLSTFVPPAIPPP